MKLSSLSMHSFFLLSNYRSLFYVSRGLFVPSKKKHPPTILELFGYIGLLLLLFFLAVTYISRFCLICVTRQCAKYREKKIKGRDKARANIALPLLDNKSNFRFTFSAQITNGEI